MGHRRDSCVRLRGPKWISSLFCSSDSLWHVCWLSWSPGAEAKPSTAPPAPTLTPNPLQLSRLLVRVCDEGFQLLQEILLSLVTKRDMGFSSPSWAPAYTWGASQLWILPSILDPSSLPTLCHLDLKPQYQFKDNSLAQLSQLGLLLLGLNSEWYKCDIFKFSLV